MSEQDWTAATQARLRDFAEAREWTRVHTPKNLLLALIGEVGELAELYQWVVDDASVSSSRLQDELADVFIYLLRFADVVGVDLQTAVTDKIERNEARFPAAEWRGKWSRDR
ncbi:nucleotide pyrophosphohydrolase [Motilibacter deserti]|uniref:Nucleotide pyrophosphohydrolase n=1 Tax=Motilibacter deserti TaxID=2714956 RepID=A0ABX0GS28_9ACTN|nr:nucleotide pyrophosphohydrolase [Motilibacter deserti]NHC12570.1 nucleotide pyrophosphohydrolase [Motilibacter deserti]